MRSEHRSYIRCDEVVAMQCAVRWISLHSSNALRVPELFSALHWERLALFPISSALPDFVCGPHCAHLARRMCRSCAVRLQHLPSALGLLECLLLFDLIIVWDESEHVGAAFECNAAEGFGQCVGHLLIGWDVLEFHCPGFDVLANEEVLYFDVLAAFADLAVTGDVHCALTVDE